MEIESVMEFFISEQQYYKDIKFINTLKKFEDICDNFEYIKQLLDNCIYGKIFFESRINYKDSHKQLIFRQ